MTPMRGLYPIVDLDTLARHGLSPLEVADAALSARPPLLQLRAKHQSPREVLALLRELKPRCRAAGTRLFANDRPDLALLAGADGVHVGQNDLPIEEVRQLSSSLLIGVSTHDLAQLGSALTLRPSYVAFGPILATASKLGAEPALGWEQLRLAAERASELATPLVAIGGLTLRDAGQLCRLGVVPAVISDLLANGHDAAQISARALEWQGALSTR
jgi:thiamine-phosphate pyrophosphorylase